jgi:PAS domain S-box-containing protein
MERALRAADYEIAIVHDREGMDKSLQESFPALMVIGEKFAGSDCFTLSGEVLARFPTMPIILYSEKDTTGLAKAALRNGLSGYLHPPLKTDDIIGEVNRCMARARKLGDWLRHEVKRTTASLAEKAKISESERAKLEAVISNIQDGVIVVDDKQNILIVNKSVREIFGLGNASLNGKPLEKVISNPDVRALITRSMVGPLKYHEVNFDDGRVFNAQVTPIPNIGAAITMQDISYLKELDHLKNDFVHTVSHDLRSPLTAVLGYTELIERTGSLSESQQEFLQRIRGSVQHITTLINDLLDLGRLEAGFDTRREAVQLEGILKYSLDMFESQANKKKIKITTDIAPNLRPLRANPIRIRQMLDNLVGNAIKYSNAGGEVYVRISMEDDQIIMEIKDSGPGIPAGEQSRIFEKFYRASNAPEGITGSGLGLAIVKSIVDSHQGRVWVESTLGKGSTFFVVFPTQE